MKLLAIIIGLALIVVIAGFILFRLVWSDRHDSRE